MKKFIQTHPIEILLSILFLTLAAILNLQFLEGANVNVLFAGHDEYLTVREVYSILQPLSFKHFFMAIVSGDVLYYGRIVFYTDALLAFLPYKIWGIEGMVYAIRMTHVAALLIAVLLLSRFAQTRIGKAFFILNVLILYYSAYFVMVPKPEPMQLLLLAIFLWKAHKANWQFGTHFIWLGVAYGAKFNVLTILPLFFILPYLFGYKKITGIIKSVLAFLAGIMIAIPSLLLAPFKPIFLKTYLASTFGKAEHYDDAGVSVATWIKTGWLGAYTGNFWLGLILILAILWVLYIGFKEYVKGKQINLYFILLLTGIGFLLPVMLFTERLWPHYLWTGHIFLLLGIVTFFQQQANKQIINNVAFFLITIGTCWSILTQGSNLYALEKQAQPKIQEANRAFEYLKSKNDTFVSVQSLSVFYPYSEALLSNRYHPFSGKRPIKPQPQLFLMSGFINPEILRAYNADYLLVSNKNFEQPSSNIQSEKDEMVRKNDELIRRELGKTIVADTVFGMVKVYRIVKD